MSEQLRENKMGTMPIGRLIATMSWPAILSMLIQALYNIVDSIFVSMISEQALAAVTYIYPVQMLLVAVGVGTGVGINSLISRRLGAKRFEEADLAASHGYRISFFNWIGFALIGLLLSDIYMKFFSDTSYILENGAAYMRIITIGSVFVLVEVTTEKILQATGNMLFPMLCSIAGAVTNVILDPLLIFGVGPFPRMGVTGAAVATILGQLVGMILGQYLLFSKEHQVKVKVRGFKMNSCIIRDIYSVGLPAILMQAMLSILQFGLNAILAGLSETAVAVNGVYGRLQSFIFMPVFGLNQGALPIMGYNYGARDKVRLMKAFKVGFGVAFTIMAIGLILFQLFPRQFLSLFNASEAMYEIGTPAFHIISLCFLPASFGILASAFFQATGHGVLSLWASLIRQMIGILPLAWILARAGGLPAVWYAFPIAEVIGVLYSIIAMRYIYKKEIAKLS
ncbi:MATE family efflux transporter [bacterium 210820-DFI.6.37]|nr:MATE family efflux transporter [bacterium 210820-DFI.6.37]